MFWSNTGGILYYYCAIVINVKKVKKDVGTHAMLSTVQYRTVQFT